MKKSLFILLALVLLSACVPLPTPVQDQTQRDSSDLLSEVTITQKGPKTRVYISPRQYAGQGMIDSLVRCYRNDEKKSFFCQLFMKVESLSPLGERQIEYEVDGQKVVGKIQVAKTQFQCGPYCDRLNCSQQCYNLYLISHTLEQKTVEELSKLALLPPEKRKPWTFTLPGSGYSPTGAILPVAMAAVLLKMDQDILP
ncbi:MAG: hypothetical protein A2527_09195 [Candidatus Lambdaproteobacteria bacterium RIFOXYD2_FULL_50_16]|uniref:Lipoprotein n=1 Tax=Candidatus Lambdaproteobacteria bacterium RIFOXYD2_FULL_50_16 TaxID=1817772 RepID=A0A1F6G7D9_9PROT|nr:MAG: hypothetical protein A2527_09195 [Candidatus Lambdaproteobacteria bacterium RIFOXYD2_FULL_50_16]